MNNRKFFALLVAFAFVFIIAGLAQEKSTDTAIDPVCGMTVNKAQAKATYEYKGTTYYFCNPGCKESFAKDPEKYLAKQASGAQTGMMGQGKMMRHGMAGGCPMMQGKAGEGCCGKMMGQGMQGHGMMSKGCCGMMGQGMMAQGCSMMDKDVERKVENTADGVTIKVSSKNPETAKKIQEHVAQMGECCAKMKDAAQKEMPKVEKE